MSILVLSEDGAASAYDTVKALSRRMLLLLDPACRTHRIRFEPLTSDDARQAVRGNLWKSTSARDFGRRRELLRTLATKLLEGDSSFVFFHVDGDRTWADREESENLARLERFRQDLARLIDMFLERSGTPAPATTPVGRLLVLSPFWCIESWLYQNTDEAVRICEERYAGQDVSRFLAWRDDRGALDEVPTPKRATCLESRHNRELAEHAFPADAVYRAGKSFAASVDGLLASDTLCAALAGTREDMRR